MSIIGINIEHKSFSLECPKCNSCDISEIVYGWISQPIKDEDSASKTGKIMYGGCCIYPDSPRWHCNSCEHEWGKIGNKRHK